jgi:hypothetical protein
MAATVSWSSAPAEKPAVQKACGFCACVFGKRGYISINPEVQRPADWVAAGLKDGQDRFFGSRAHETRQRRDRSQKVAENPKYETIEQVAFQEQVWKQ